MCHKDLCIEFQPKQYIAGSIIGSSKCKLRELIRGICLSSYTQVWILCSSVNYSSLENHFVISKNTSARQSYYGEEQLSSLAVWKQNLFCRPNGYNTIYNAVYEWSMDMIRCAVRWISQCLYHSWQLHTEMIVTERNGNTCRLKVSIHNN